jgi:Tol biopolymer transport system component
MTAPERLDRDLRTELADIAAPRYPDYIDDVLARAVRDPQRPAWTFPERWLPMSVHVRRTALAPTLPLPSLVLLLVLALLIGAVLVLAGSQRRPAPPYGPAANGVVALAVDGDIVAHDLAAGTDRILVGGPEIDVYPTFSRDGTRLAFFRLTDGGSPLSLMVADADGGNVRSLIGPVHDISAAWSPRSDELAVVVDEGGLPTLSVIPVDGGPGRSLDTGDVAPVMGSIEWRPPDGRELLLVGRSGTDYAIYAVTTGSDAPGIRRLTEPDTADAYSFGGALAPDGSRLAYVRGVEPLRIHLVDLDMGSDRVFGEGLAALPYDIGSTTHQGAPMFSPDGSRLVFGRYWDEHDGTINHQVFAASADGDGSDAVAIGPLHRSQSGHDPFGVAVAPDGTRVLIQMNDAPETWLADPRGGAPEELPWGLRVEDRPDWQRIAP